MHERYGMMGLAFAACALAMSTPTPEEEEERRIRKTMYAIQEFARAFGPNARFYGYDRHPATRGGRTKSASLQRMIGRKKYR